MLYCYTIEQRKLKKKDIKCKNVKKKLIINLRIISHNIYYNGTFNTDFRLCQKGKMDIFY